MRPCGRSATGSLQLPRSGRGSGLTPQDSCQPQRPDRIQKGDGNRGGHAEQSQFSRQSLAAPGQDVCGEEPDAYPNQPEGAAESAIWPFPNVSNSLAKPKL